MENGIKKEIRKKKNVGFKEFSNSKSFIGLKDFKENGNKSFVVNDFTTVDFKGDEKIVLDFESGESLALNQTNLDFLINAGFSTPAELKNKTITMVREIRKIGIQNMEGIFIIKVE
jgi:hypothetical protein